MKRKLEGTRKQKIHNTFRELKMERISNLKPKKK